MAAHKLIEIRIEEGRNGMTVEELVCLDEGDGVCKGEVNYHSVGNSLRAWPRCDRHADLRWERYENSMEKYADCSVEPDWFDPSYAGERWSDDY